MDEENEDTAGELAKSLLIYVGLPFLVFTVCFCWCVCARKPWGGSRKLERGADVAPPFFFEPLSTIRDKLNPHAEVPPPVSVESAENRLGEARRERRRRNDMRNKEQGKELEKVDKHEEKGEEEVREETENELNNQKHLSKSEKKDLKAQEDGDIGSSSSSLSSKHSSKDSKSTVKVGSESSC